MTDNEEIGPITSIEGLNRARDDQRNEYLVLATTLADGTTADLCMTHEAAARILLLLQRVRKDEGWVLRDADIDEIDIH